MKKPKLQNVSEDDESNTQSSTSGREYSEPIPLDLLIEICLRVPPKSIARFRCVSKSWSSMLCCPYFTERFLTKSWTRPQLLLAFQDNENLFFYSAPQRQNPDDNAPVIVADYLTYFPTKFSSRVCRPANGMICRQATRWTESGAAVCNLSMREFVTLPEVEIPRTKSRLYFGYDPIEKQYKVLCMTWPLRGKYYIASKVLTVGNGKQVWRETEFCRLHYPFNEGICINGVLYYPADINRRRPPFRVSVIGCFDVRSEKFSFINMDHGMVIRSDSILINYKGKLGVLEAQNDHDKGIHRNTRAILMWVLEDVNENKWSNRFYKLPYGWWKPDDPYLRFVGLAGTGEIVLSPYFLHSPFYVFCYNLERKTIRRVEIRGVEAHMLSVVHVFTDYVENVTPMQVLTTS